MSQTEALSYEIELTQDVKQSILSYFDISVKTISEFQGHLSRYRELDFLRMRRFLNTTYRTLLELDSQFMASKLKVIHDELNRVTSVYDLFMKKSHLGRLAFDKVFLSVQDDFSLLEKKFEINKEKIVLIDIKIEQLKDSHRRHKHRLSQSDVKSQDYNNLVEVLKKIELQIQATLKEKQYFHNDNMVVDKALMDFLRMYKHPFSLSFEELVEHIELKLLRILNVMAFEFDIELWHKAKQSRIIKEYFRNFSKTEVIGSKLYLEHYLKNLNQAHLRQEHKELQVLLDYLKQVNPIRIVVLMPKVETLKLFKFALEADKSGFEILCYNDAKIALKSAFSQETDLFILDTDLGETLLENFVQTYKTHLSPGRRKKAKLMLVTDIVDETILLKAKTLQADSVIERDVEAVEIIDSVYTLIKL